MEATIIEVAKESDGQQRWLLVLDKTIFYPRGGGQATDQGFLFTDTWKGKVSQVLLKEGKILHYVEGDQPPPVGTLVKGSTLYKIPCETGPETDTDTEPRIRSPKTTQHEAHISLYFAPIPPFPV